LPGDSKSSGNADLEAQLMQFLQNPNLIVPVVSALAVIIIAIIVICVLKGRNNNISKAQRAAYSTWDPRKQSMQAQGEHPYQEIPYGDGPGPRGPVPDVPQHYAQLPPVPQRQGWFYLLVSILF
jgi:hypothetical protein